MYQIEYSKQALKNLKSIPKRAVLNIFRHIDDLMNDPHPHGSIKLTGSEQTYRIRVGVYRIVYDVYDTELVIKVIDIDHRKDVYR